MFIKFIKTTIYSIVALGILLPSVISCQSAYVQLKKKPIVHTSLPYKSFARIGVSRGVAAESCISKKQIAECEELIKKLPVVQFNSMGSGTLVKHNNQYFVLTAAHVCELETPEKTDYSGFSFKLKPVKTEISVTLWGGLTFKAKEFILQEKNDLCAIPVSDGHMLPKPVILAKKGPLVGDKVINIASPHGITGPYMNLIFDGRYAGVSKGFSYYTIPARPGSSGSAVLNEKFEVIGTISIAYNGFENVGIGNGLKEIKQFLDGITKKN